MKFPQVKNMLKSQYYTAIWFLQFICKENHSLLRFYDAEASLQKRLFVVILYLVKYYNFSQLMYVSFSVSHLGDPLSDLN